MNKLIAGFVVSVFLICRAALPAADEPIPLVANESIKPVLFESLVYPLPARLKRVQGAVVVKVDLDDSGRPTSTRAISGPKVLVAACLKNALQWRFEGNNERAAIIIYRFVIEGLCNNPCPSQFRVEPPNVAVITIGDPVMDHSANQ